MRIAQILAGISLAEADVLERRWARRMRRSFEASSRSSRARRSRAATHPRSSTRSPGRSRRSAATASTSRTRVAYSIISYHTAWLKTHYPAEFMAALLSSQIGDADSVVKYINEARELGIEVLPPDVNESGYKFTVIGDKRMRFGLGAIRNVGHARDRLDSRRARAMGRSHRSSICASASISARATSACSRRSSRPARSTRSAGIARSISPRSTRRCRKRGSSRTRPRADRARSSALANADEAPRPQLSRSLPNISRVERQRAARARRRRFSASTSPGIRSSRSAPRCEIFATHSVSTLGRWVETPMFLGVRGDGDQAAGEQAERLGVRAVDGRGFLRIFRSARLSRGVGAPGRSHQARCSRTLKGRLLASATRRWTIRRSSSSRSRRSRSCAPREMSRSRSSSPPARRSTADVMHDVREMVRRTRGLGADRAPMERWQRHAARDCVRARSRSRSPTPRSRICAPCSAPSAFRLVRGS